MRQLDGTVWSLQFGARLLHPDLVQFRVWAPEAESVSVHCVGLDASKVPMQQDKAGSFVAEVPASAGADYLYILNDHLSLPDPVSRWQPNGVHGPSRVVDVDGFAWSDQSWRGLPLEQFCIYELHIGTFTDEGTFASAMERLEHLQQLGITAVELLPVAQFAGERNWGYDGVFHYAPQASYGGPQGLKELVNACHNLGLAVVLDVVPNHLGPKGNVLHDFGPYFTSKYRTPWGSAINFDGPNSDPVRRHFVDNALYWQTEYHIDALRLDAIHGIYDFGAYHVLEQMADACQQQSEHLNRPFWLIAESDLNDARVIRPQDIGGYGLHGQWCDDFHHSLHTLVNPNQRGYFVDFGRVEHLAKALGNGYVYDGVYSTYRRRHHGNNCGDRSGQQFIVYNQNHDQIANACVGERLSTIIEPDQLRLQAAILLCSPFVPLLFMGEEYGEQNPFYYFVSHGDEDLNRSVSRGRRREYGFFYSAPLPGFEKKPFMEPHHRATFDACKLDWDQLSRQPNQQRLALFRDLLAVRQSHPALHNCRQDLARVQYGEEPRFLTLFRTDPGGDSALLVCNLSSQIQEITLPELESKLQQVLWTEAQQYGGADGAAPPKQLQDQETMTLGSWQAVLYINRGPGGEE